MFKSYELIPMHCTNKSFYRKAIVKVTNKGYILQSYNTDVVAIDYNGKIYRLWSGWSATTARHVNDFLQQHNHNKLSKKEWLQLPIEQF